MKYDIKEHSLIVLKDGFKNTFLKDFREKLGLYDIKVMELSELKKKFYFDYTKKTVYYVHKNYNVIGEIAQIYVENLYFIDRANTGDEKVNFLSTLKRELVDKRLLKIDSTFRNSLKNFEVVLFDLKNVDNFHENMFADIAKITKVTAIDDDRGTETAKRLYRLANKEEEVSFVASEIVNLIKSGIPIDHIKLANVNKDYHFVLKRTFEDFKIPLELPNEESIASTILVSKFKELFSNDIKSTFESLKEYVKDTKDQKVFDKLIDVVNEYTWCDDYMEVKDFIFQDIAKVKVPNNIYKNAVKTVDFMSEKIKDEDYVFLLNFNEGVIPTNKKDEDYLDDQTKLALGLSDSIDLNKKSIEEVRTKIALAKNLVVTLSKTDLNGELYISNAYTEELFDESNAPRISFCHSNSYNKRVLLKEKDENKKYGTISRLLTTLEAHYKDVPYDTFDNKFKGINEEHLNDYLDNKLTLSYSSMDTYYKCAYRYYLSNIIKVDKFEDTFEIVVGNIFHEVLSKCFKTPFDFESAWQKAIEHQEYDFKNMEKFYLGMLKGELAFIIDTINRQKEYCSLDEALYEQKIIVPLDDKGDVIFKGFVDKILYGEFEGKKIAAIVDYKTGNPELSLDNVIYGLDMQLPIYSYLIENFEPLKGAEIGGFYLQKILSNTNDQNKKIESLKLQGYSNSDVEILKYVDKSYEDSHMIKSLKMGPNGFYNYAKILSTDQIDKLNEIVKQKIQEAAKDIKSAKFDIDPKQIDDKLVGCKFCKFKDICYMTAKDIVIKEKKTKDDFLGGEKNANVD